MSSIIKLLFILMFVALLSCSGNSGSKSTDVSISFSGAFALYPLVQTWVQEYNRTHPAIRFDIQAGGAGKGMTDVLAGATDVGMFSREISDAEKAKGIWWIALCKDAVLPTVNPANTYINAIRTKGITKQQFEAIFVNQSITRWDSLLGISSARPEKISVYTRSDASGAADSWAAFFGKKQENLKGLGMNGDPGVSDAVKRDKNGIGYNNTLFLFDAQTGKQMPGIEAVPIDINGNGQIDANENYYSSLKTFLQAVNNGSFPSPPARDLYFITKGKTDKKETADFFKWVLTNGQQFVQSAGYVPLPKNIIDEQLKKLQ